MFEKRHNYIICADSDGCAIDSMTIKHQRCFGPEMIKVWNLQEHKKEMQKKWDEDNLYTITRGINRFKGLVLALTYACQRGWIEEELSLLKEWTACTKVLSANSLQKEIALHKNEPGCKTLEKALLWSERVNQSIDRLPDVEKPAFPEVKKALLAAKKRADVAVVSAANAEAVEREWQYNGLEETVDIFFTQENGSKAECLKKLREYGYDKEHILMIGDAPGDVESARDAGVLFYPILTGREAESWKKFTNVILKSLIQGKYSCEWMAEETRKFYEKLEIGR